MPNMNITTLEDLNSAITTALTYEDRAKWATGDVLCVAIESGLHTQIGGVRKLEQHAAQMTGRGWRTMHRRRLVSATFPPSQRSERVAWETHTRIAELCKGDVPSALAWLQVAADDEMTADQIEATIKAAEGNAERGERVYLCRAAQARVLTARRDELLLEMDRVVDAKPGQIVIVTIAYDTDVQLNAQEGHGND